MTLWLILVGISEKNLEASSPPSRLVELYKAPPITLSRKPLQRFVELGWTNNQWTESSTRHPFREQDSLKINRDGPFLVLIDGAPEGPALKKLKEIFKKWESKEDLIFLSPSDSTLKDLRALGPRWSYGTGYTFLARLLLFSSLKLLGLLTIPGDVIHIHSVRKVTTDEADKILHFARVRGKTVIFDSRP